MNFKSSPSISSINVVQLCLTMNLIKWEILIYMYNAWAHRFNGFNICLLASSIPSWLAASQIPTEPSRPVLAEPYLQLIDVAVAKIVQIKQHRSKTCLSEGCAVSDGPFDGGVIKCPDCLLSLLMIPRASASIFSCRKTSSVFPRTAVHGKLMSQHSDPFSPQFPKVCVIQAAEHLWTIRPKCC